MNSHEVVIGVDGGTTAVKAVAFDLSGGVRSVHSVAVPVNYGPNGEADQDMEAIWQGVATCLHKVAVDCAGDHIIAIGLTGQGDGAWLVDEKGRPVRPAATWLDGRAGHRVQQWMADGRADKVLATTGTTVFGGLFPILYEELRTSDPAALEHAQTNLYCKDWIRFRLTGERCTDYTEASRTFFDINTTSGYSQQLAEALGEAPALDLLPPIRHADELGGTVTKQASHATGIPEGTPVGVGMMDTDSTGIGLGAVDAGQGWLILGTTAFVGGFLADADQRQSTDSMVVATGQGHQVLEFLVPMTGTPNLDWIRRILGLADTSWAEIESKARRSPVGAGGVVYLPYASPGGERAPFVDPNASASWTGMSLTTPDDQILRSVYEGVTFSLVECVRALKMDDDLVVSGGGFRSDLVCEILADATGQRVVRQDTPEAGARGAAVLALVSAGAVPDIKTASDMLKTGMEEFLPRPENKSCYEQTYSTFLKTRNALQPLWPEMRALRHQKEE